MMSGKKNKFVDEKLERGLISSILEDTSVLDDNIEKIDSNMFYNQLHRKLFKKIKEMYLEKGKISKTKIMIYGSKKFSKKKMEKIFNTEYINPLEIDEMINELKKLFLKRVLRQAFKRGYDYLLNDDLKIKQIKSKVQDIIFTATSDNLKSNLLYSAEDVAMESLDRLIDREAGKTISRIKTGIKSLDAMLGGGLGKKHLSILAARPSMGKTAKSINIISNVLQTSDTGILFVSLEMERVELMDRLLIQKSKVAADDYYNTAKNNDDEILTEKQRNSIEIARDWIHEKPLMITDERGLSVDDIKSISRKANNLFDNKLGLIVIDYLSEIKTTAKGGRWDKGVADVIRELRNFSKEINSHILLLHQINRDFKNRSNKRPRLSDLRDTGEAEEKADDVFFLHRPEYFESRKNGTDESLIQTDTEFIIAKQRGGKTGTIFFAWYPEILYFQDIRDYNIYGEINYLKQED